jgi:hypothetical protein
LKSAVWSFLKNKKKERKVLARRRPLQNDEEEEELLDPAMIAAWPMHSCGTFKTGVTLTFEVLPSAPS